MFISIHNSFPLIVNDFYRYLFGFCFINTFNKPNFEWCICTSSTWAVWTTSTSAVPVPWMDDTPHIGPAQACNYHPNGGVASFCHTRQLNTEGSPVAQKASIAGELLCSTPTGPIRRTRRRAVRSAFPHRGQNTVRCGSQAGRQRILSVSIIT